MQKAAKEEENIKKEVEGKKNEIVDLEKKFQDLNKNVKKQIAVSNKLISDGKKKKVKKCFLENGNITETRVSQNLITDGMIANEELKVKKDEAHSLASIINQKKVLENKCILLCFFKNSFLTVF